MMKQYYNRPLGFGELHLHYCGYENDFISCSLHVRDCFLMHYVTKGEGEFVLDGKTYPICQGMAFLISPNLFTSYRSVDEACPISFSWIAVGGSSAKKILHSCHLSIEHPVTTIEQSYGIDMLIKKISHAVSDKRSQFEILSQLYFIISQMEKCALQSIQSKYPVLSMAQTYVSAAVQFIECNYMKDIHILQIAKHIGIERTYFSKIFKCHTSHSPQEYLLRYRINKAITLMKDKNAKLKEIAVCVGIPDPYYFSRIFKKVSGKSPSFYMKELSI